MTRKVLGVEFAPLRIPFSRRRQTLAFIIAGFLFIGFPIAANAFFLFALIFIPFFGPLIVIAYATWMIKDLDVGETGGRRFDSWPVRILRNSSIFQQIANYFPVQLVRTCENPEAFSPNRNYIFCGHPHGIICFGGVLSFGTDALDFKGKFPGLTPRLLTLRQNFWLPIGREFVASTGACAASERGISAILDNESKGKAAVLIVGGGSESLEHGQFEIPLVLNRRRGFIRLALKHGSPLVPVFFFGEQFVYEQADNPQGSFIRRMQTALVKQFGFTLPFFFGRGVFQYTFGMMPFRKAVNAVVGSPIEVPKIENPTKDDLDHWHAKYVDDLKKLYETFNPIYGDKNVKLVIN